MNKSVSYLYFNIIYLDIDAYTFFLQMISFFILFHNTVPVTLQVYIELVRFIQVIKKYNKTNFSNY